MKAIIFALCAVALVAFVAARTEQEYRQAFTSFTAQYAKTYKHDEFRVKYAVFKSNLDYIDNFNLNQNTTFTLAMNKFGDLTNTEFSRTYLGLKVNANRQRPASVSEFTAQAGAALPDSWDWNAKGAVTPIKDQGQCGSCWSFSTTGSTEGCTFIATKTLVSLSEQDLVDCSTSQGNEGCDGGLMDQAFEYIIANKGIELEADYPYTAQDGTCSYNAADCGATITSYKDVTSGSEDALQQAVYAAPVSIAIDASQSSFQFYSTGVYNEPDCSSQSLDHGVLAAGWGVDGSTPYWQVKNSWGTSWGQQGWIWMSRNKSNQCGVATMASFPTGCATC